MLDLVIVIPCYNEEKGLKLQEQYIFNFLKNHKNIFLLFVNDGSQDNTLGILKNIEKKIKNNINIYECSKNVGKAEAIRKGILSIYEKLKFKKIAFLDADFSTSLEECKEISNYIKKPICFSFGSRILKIDNQIKRKWYRFLIGRIISTIISNNILKMPVYDTQCGCKIFSREIILFIFKKKFISKWLFDVEIFYRFILHYGRENLKNIVLEIPLKKWVDDSNSSVSFFYFFTLWWDLFLIRKYYSIREKNKLNKKK